MRGPRSGMSTETGSLPSQLSLRSAGLGPRGLGCLHRGACLHQQRRIDRLFRRHHALALSQQRRGRLDLRLRVDQSAHPINDGCSGEQWTGNAAEHGGLLPELAVRALRFRTVALLRPGEREATHLGHRCVCRSLDWGSSMRRLEPARTGQVTEQYKERHMTGDLEGRRVAFLVAPEGAEQVELTEPWKAVSEAG